MYIYNQDEIAEREAVLVKVQGEMDRIGSVFSLSPDAIAKVTLSHPPTHHTLSLTHDYTHMLCASVSAPLCVCV